MVENGFHREKRRVNLTKLWSPQLHLSDHLHVVIKEHAHKCNPYFDPISSISDLKMESRARLFQVTRRGRNTKGACSCRSAACACSIIASPSYLKIDLNRPNGFLSRDLGYPELG